MNAVGIDVSKGKSTVAVIQLNIALRLNTHGRRS